MPLSGNREQQYIDKAFKNRSGPGNIGMEEYWVKREEIALETA